MQRRSSPPTLRSTVLPTLLVTLLALVAVAATATPAHAGRRTITDAQGDVIKQVGQRPPKAAPGQAAADITVFVTALTQQRLTLTTTVRDLPKNYWAMLWQIQTDGGVLYDLDLLKTGSVKFELSQSNVPLPCEGMTRSLNPVKKKVTVTVPIACVGNPAWVRTGAGAASTSRDFARIFTDDANLPGQYRQGTLTLGRTVKRG